MIKVFGMLNKRSNISQSQFHKHWSGPHAVHALTLVPVMRRYVQNHKSAKAYPGFDAPCDGSPEVWLQDTDAARLLNTMPEYMNGAYIDEPAFMRERSAGIMACEHVIIEGDPVAETDKLVKVLFFVKRNPALTPEQFHDQWLALDGPLFSKGENLRRFVRSPTLASAYADGDALYDGAEELWWDTEAAFNKDKRGAPKKADRANLLDVKATHAMFVDENRVFWPGLAEDE